MVPKWMAFPAVAAVGVGIGALTSACGDNREEDQDTEAINTGGSANISQVLEATRV